uniref:Uncharacterized protein n=1 Tax=Rhizophora mucronata TaxID=61149 RepID=A0A2P2J2S0_RHIMU
MRLFSMIMKSWASQGCTFSLSRNSIYHSASFPLHQFVRHPTLFVASSFLVLTYFWTPRVSR